MLMNPDQNDGAGNLPFGMQQKRFLLIHPEKREMHHEIYNLFQRSCVIYLDIFRLKVIYK